MTRGAPWLCALVLCATLSAVDARQDPIWVTGLPDDGTSSSGSIPEVNFRSGRLRGAALIETDEPLVISDGTTPPNSPLIPVAVPTNGLPGLTGQHPGSAPLFKAKPIPPRVGKQNMAPGPLAQHQQVHPTTPIPVGSGVPVWEKGPSILPACTPASRLQQNK